MAVVQLRGLEARQGEPSAALLVLRLREPVSGAKLRELVRYVAPMLADPDGALDELDDGAQLLAVRWSPPEAGHAVDAQRRLVESAARLGVEAAWCLQTATCLELPGDVFEDDLDEPTRPFELEAITAAEPALAPQEDPPDRDAAACAGAAEVRWSAGPPPRQHAVEFPVDGYPDVLAAGPGDELGLACKLAGPALPGIASVLRALHALWLAPYGGRHRHAGVTYDPAHHAVHLWVERLDAPCTAEELVGHLLWIAARLDEIVPVVHARLAAPSAEQKYGGLVPGAAAPFVLGGNPVRAIHARGGEDAVDAWLEQQGEWSADELARMLRELAIELVTAAANEGEGDDDDDDDGDDDDDDDDDDGDDDAYDDDDDDHDDDDDDDEAEGNVDEDRGRHITTSAGDVLRARALAGRLDPRATAALLPVLDQPAPYEQRRRVVAEVLGGQRAHGAVPGLIRVLEGTSIESSLDAIGKQGLIASAAAALGAIGDPSAIGVLARVVAAPGRHNDPPRAAAAAALAACLDAAPAPRDVDDAALAQLLATIRERDDGELVAESHFAYGRLARHLPASRRDEARRLLAETPPACDEPSCALARHAALAICTPEPVAPAEVRALLHEALTSLGHDHEATVRDLRIALGVAELLPALVDPVDLVWLARFAEPDLRARVHALLERLGHPLPPAPAFDACAARELDDAELVRLIAEPHVVGRAALIAEVGRRGLGAAHRAVADACHDVASRARPGTASLLDPDTAVVEAAVAVLGEPPISADAIALFDRVLRHPSFHLKWPLVKQAPHDVRLIGGMLHVLGERRGWQESAAEAWLARFAGTPEYEAERARLARPVEAGGGDDDDEDIN